MLCISACTKEDQWSLALKTFQSMLKKGMKPNLVACNALINTLGKAGKVGLVFKVYSVAKSLGHRPDEYTWNALLTAIYKADRYEDVLQLFDMIRSESLCGVNGYLYNRALMSCQKLGCWEKAVKLLYEMEGSGLAVSTPSYNLVLSACEKSGSLKLRCEYMSIWFKGSKAEPDVSLYNAAIHAWDVFKT
ncbi:hypothetical protein F2Q69_00024641 [Brassica cretica]|uniref:Pentacotripeptide-repeat region of PRORP domain-containing protein n=1 Tax=Brassica cretica TaxID=69181 RepID=A0A8S9QSN6_BRACR|nr:hypothetical protein F2Q69_00024641 [Brassica cretica]